MSYEQFVFFRPDGTPSGSVDLAAVMSVAGKRVESGAGPFALKENEHELRKDQPRGKVLRLLRRHLSNVDVGNVYRIVDNSGDVAFKVRETVQAFRVINTSGNANADEFWSWVVATYPGFNPRFAGAYVCKSIAGSSVASQHSFGNADDIFFDTMAHQVEVFHDVEAGKAPVKVAHAISGSRIWEPGAGEHGYTGEYHAHLHCDFAPNFSGGCGVRNG